MITRGCTGSFYPSYKTSLHRESGERTRRRERVRRGSLGRKRRKKKQPWTRRWKKEERKRRISVSTADLIGFIRGKCVRPRPCNPFFTLARLNRKPLGALCRCSTRRLPVSPKGLGGCGLSTRDTSAFHNLP